MGFGASNGGGYAVNHLDIAPQLASLVLAFYNMGGQGMGGYPGVYPGYDPGAGGGCWSSDRRAEQNTRCRYCGVSYMSTTFLSFLCTRIVKCGALIHIASHFVIVG